MKPPESYKILNEAAVWYSILNSDNTTTHDQEQWAQWLNQDPDHRAAWQEVESITDSLSSLRSFDTPNELGISQQLINANHFDIAANKTKTTRRSIVKGLASLPFIAGAWQAHEMGLINEWTLPYRSDFSNSQRKAINYQMADGTRITLAIKSGIKWSHSPSESHITLLAGDLAIQQAASSVPATIMMKNHAIKLQHTHLVIRQSPDIQVQDSTTSVAVINGSADICRHNDKASLVLDAGQKVLCSRTAFSSIQEVSPIDLAWTNNILQANNMTLEHWASVINQHHSSYVNCHPSIKQLLVMGSFPLDNTPLALSMLQNVLPVQIRHLTPLWTLIEPVA